MRKRISVESFAVHVIMKRYESRRLEQSFAGLEKKMAKIDIDFSKSVGAIKPVTV